MTLWTALAAARGARGVALAFFLACWALALQAAPAKVVLDASVPSLDADNLATFWMDSRGDAGISQVARVGSLFQPATANAIHVFSPGGALWLHYRLERQPGDRHGWLLAFPNPVLDSVVVYQKDGEGRWQSQAAGDTVAMASWPEPGRYAAFRLDLPPGQARDIYVQVRSLTPISLPVRLASDSAHDQQIQVEYMALGAAFGALVLLIAACLAQSWVYRDVIYAWYAVYASLTMLCLMAYTGVAAHLLWTGSGFWADTSQGVLASLAAGSALMFVRSLTGISARHRLLDRIALAGGPLGLVLGLAYVFLPRQAGLVAMASYVTFAVVTNILIAWLSWRRRDAVGLWVLAAYTPLGLAVLLALVRIFGLLPISFITQYALVAAMALEVPLLLVALTIRSRDRHGAQIRALALSSQDALTGLLAPHLFHDRLRQVVARYRRDRESAAVVFIDLVNHGRIKAHYGPAVAEQSLLRSVIKLRRLLRDVDTVSRIGEARFALILEGIGSRTAVTDRAARLIAAGLMPLQGLKPDVTLQFHIAGVLLSERIMETPDLVSALDALLARMSPRTRRPIRFLDADAALPASLPASGHAADAQEDSQIQEPAASAAAATVAR